MMAVSSALGLLGLLAPLTFSPGVLATAAELQLSCGAGESWHAACTEVALLRRSSPGVALIQHKGTLSVTSVLRIDAARIAAHVRSHRAVPENLAASLQAGLEAFDAASKQWTASPPDITGGITTLAMKLFEAVEGTVPEETRSTEDFAEFRKEWMRVFGELPTMVESIEEDIRAFARKGEADKLIRAINTLLLEAGAVVSKLLPEETGDEVAKYLGAVVDVIDGLGDAIQTFGQGEAPAAIEVMYQGLKSAIGSLVAERVRNDDTYEAVVSALDATLGGLSRHVLEYQQQLERSQVCWKGFKSRERKRPSECEEGYAWDGEQWCLYREASPVPRAALLEHSVAAKRPRGALPARCGDTPGFAEKHGAWCYMECPAGYEPTGTRCQAKCGAAYPSNSALMCGKTSGAIAAASTKMITETVTQALTISSLAQSMESSGLDLAAKLERTMQALIDMGKPFAHPGCPV